MSNRISARAHELIELPTEQVVEVIDLAAELLPMCAENLHDLDNEEGAYVDQESLEYTYDLDLKYAVFQMHAQLGTNFFIRFRKLYGEISEINTGDDTIIAQMSDGTTLSTSIHNPLLAVEKEEWLAKIEF